VNKQLMEYHNTQFAPNLGAADDILLHLLNQRCPALGALSVHLAAVGLESRIYRAHCRVGDFAIKIPLAKLISNDNDQGIDSKDLLQQEFLLQQYLRGMEFPVPEPYALLSGDFPTGLPPAGVLIYRFVETDSAPLSMKSFGAVMAHLHSLPTPDLVPVAQRAASLEETLADLILRRMSTVMRLSARPFPMPNRLRLLTLLRDAGRQRSMLHMDARPANLLTWRGEVVALLDWSNFLIGPPVLELCRIAEYGYLDETFLEGYGRNPLAEIPRGTELALRSYTSSMLAIVFLSESPDAVRAAEAVARASELAEAMTSC
jgi:aminoglycoside phosphotransferase (APT) family kinase protein